MSKRNPARGKNRATKSGEALLLKRIENAAQFRRQKTANAAGIRLGIGDDAALWRPRRGFETILTCDWFLEGTHFLRDVHPVDAVGWKCLARAVSDIAAMGGEPRCFLLSLALPESDSGRWLHGFLGGLRRASRKFRCPLAGGETTRCKDILINLSVVGEVKAGQGVLRSGARPGDKLFVSGRLGEAELGLRYLRKNKQRPPSTQEPRLKKHLYLEPRLALGQWLATRRLATAMMDLSDGLSSDLTRLCHASGAGATIQVERIPLPGDIFLKNFSNTQRLNAALHGGDDYELLFTVAQGNARKIPRRIFGVALTEIGEITSGRKINLLNPAGKPVPLHAGGWDPFRK